MIAPIIRASTDGRRPRVSGWLLWLAGVAMGVGLVAIGILLIGS